MTTKVDDNNIEDAVIVSETPLSEMQGEVQVETPDGYVRSNGSDFEEAARKNETMVRSTIALLKSTMVQMEVAMERGTAKEELDALEAGMEEDMDALTTMIEKTLADSDSDEETEDADELEERIASTRRLIAEGHELDTRIALTRRALTLWACLSKQPIPERIYLIDEVSLQAMAMLEKTTAEEAEKAKEQGEQASKEFTKDVSETLQKIIDEQQ